MTDQAITPTPTATSQRRSLVAKVPIGIVAMVAAVATSSQWCFVGFAAAAAALCVDVLVDPLDPTSLRRRAASLGIRLLVAAVVGVAVGWLLRATPEWAFREAMGIDLPAGIHVTSVQRHYAGGGGDHSLIVEFTADESVIKSLIPTWVVERSADSYQIRAWSVAGRTWEAALDCFPCLRSQPFVKMSWMRIRPLENPQVYDLGGVNDGNSLLLYDAASKRGVILHDR